MSNSLKEQYASSPLYGSNAAAIEALYEQFVENPDSVSEGWRRYFRTSAIFRKQTAGRFALVGLFLA